MEKSEALTYLKQITKFNQPEILEKMEGKHNQNFVFDSNEGKFVLRKNLETVEKLSLKSERRTLEFLADKNIEFAPESRHYDEERDIHIIDFVGREEAFIPEMKDELLEELAKKLGKIHSMSYEEYKTFCQRKEYDPESPDTRRNLRAKTYSYLEVASKNLNQRELIEAVERKADQLESRTEDSKSLYLAHGDLAGSIRRGDGELYFIDWEFAGFTPDPEHDLGDIFIKRDLAEYKIEKIKRIYREERNGEIEIKDKIDEYREIFSVFQTAWLLKKAAEFKKAGDKEWKRYMKMAEEKKSNIKT